VNKLLAYGGYIASAVLIVFGVGMIAAGAIGQSDVRDRLEMENVVGSPDMSPEAIETEYTEQIPDCDVAEELINTGSEAQCFADYMRIHVLDQTGGQTYSEMDRFIDESGNPTSDEAEAAIDPLTGESVSNPARDTWVTETALTTALNTSFFAESVAKFTIAVGVILILVGIGLVILTRFTLVPQMLRRE